MVSDSEKKFRDWLKHANGSKSHTIIKIPDYKQTGGSSGRGLPDYLLIQNGRHIWFEVKYSLSERRFAFSLMEQSQWETLTRLHTRGKAEIWIACYFKDVLWFFTYERLMFLYSTADTDTTSVSLEDLGAVWNPLAKTALRL